MTSSLIADPTVESVHVEAPVPTVGGMSGSKIAAILLMAAGAVLTLVGLMTGLVSHSAGTADCGSGFSPNTDIVWATECFGMTDSARTLALVLLVPGIIAVGVGMIMALAGAGGAFSGMFHQPTLAELEARNANADA